MGKSVFLLGTGFIGGSVLDALLQQKGRYEIAALCRDDKKAKKLEELGVRPVRGELSSDEVISKEAEQNDIILHIATADDLPSVKSILKGLEKRDTSKPPAVYIHTSGTGVLTVPTHPDDVCFNDKDQAKFDTLIPDHAPHREIDLTIKRAVEEKRVHAKVAIMMPPCIYGLGTGPFNRRSIQIPGWAKEAVKVGHVINHGPQNFWNNIHIRNLVSAYQTLLAHLEETEETKGPLYIIAETGSHRWGPLGVLLDKILKERNLVKEEMTEEKEGSTETETGTQSRSKSEWLHEWGWKVESEPSIQESMPEEIDHMREIGEL
ncbi:hypothetical protein JCM10908_000399 [Rhodotorula pacifica]|uniref:uncharacterized protein n=1 Tax=Rhodotorula pacifica TaxID=1495444 RepID=UPI00318060B0